MVQDQWLGNVSAFVSVMVLVFPTWSQKGHLIQAGSAWDLSFILTSILSESCPRGTSVIYMSPVGDRATLTGPSSSLIRFSSSVQFSSVQFSSVIQSCPTLCDPMNRSTPGLPVHHQLLEFIQTHIHRVSDAIQPSHPLSSPSPPAPNLSQHQNLLQ